MQTRINKNLTKAAQKLHSTPCNRFSYHTNIHCSIDFHLKHRFGPFIFITPCRLLKTSPEPPPFRRYYCTPLSALPDDDDLDTNSTSATPTLSIDSISSSSSTIDNTDNSSDDGDGEKEQTTTSSSSSSTTAASVDLQLPRRSMLVTFTCNKCDTRTERLVNPVAWNKGMVICQCAGCQAWHQLADAAGLVDEIRYTDDDA